MPKPSSTTRTIGRGRWRSVDWVPAVTRQAAGAPPSTRPARRCRPSRRASATPPRRARRRSGLGHELVDVRRGHAAAVEDRNASSLRPGQPGRRESRGSLGHGCRIRPGGVAAGADRPDGFVRDDQPAGGDRGRVCPPSAPRSWPGRRRPPAGLALCEIFADAQDRAQAGIDRPAELAAISSSVSPASRRRSEWPTITHDASPTSIGAETSPV